MTIPSIYQPANYGSSAFVQGFLPQSWTNTTVVYGPGSARAYTSDWILEYPSNIAGAPGTITINTAVVGLNGTYPGTIASITPTTGVYMAPVYAVGNSSGTTDGSLVSTNNVIPALVIATASTGFVPAGNDMFRQVGFVFINSSGNLVPYAMSGHYQNRTVTLQDAILVLNGGAVIGPTKVDMQIGTLSSPSTNYYLPYSSTKALNLRVAFTNNTNDDTGFIVPHGLTVASIPPTLFQGPVNTVIATYSSVVIAPGNDAGNCAVDYSVSATDCAMSIWLAGFDYNLPWNGSVG